jgi:phosphatidylserine/phosphatidylglycerophosphate/cardiolipin synthase-like enzyme
MDASLFGESIRFSTTTSQQLNRELSSSPFAAHHVPDLCKHLAQAVKRGVETTLIVECEGESEGQLTRDAAEAFRSIELTRVKIYYWPLGKRQRNQAGRPGKLHMKCAIVDGVALIGSANLTDDAFNRNMELGVLVREQSTVFELVEHFKELVRLGVLVRAPTASALRIAPSNPTTH